MNSRQHRMITFKMTNLIRWAFGIVGGLIGLQVLLRLAGANPGAPVARFIYKLTDTLL